MTARNEQIGTVACPFPGCKVSCPLFKYTPRADGRRSAFTGKWYAACADHGRIDGASGKATQDYLLDKGAVWGARKPESTEPENPEIPERKPELSPVATVATQPAKPAHKPEPKPDLKPKNPEASGWGYF